MKAATRLTPVAVVLLLVLVTGCARSKPAPVVLPAADAVPVAQWSHEGGFMEATWSLIAAPTLVVYSDGRVIHQAGTQLVLPTAEVTTLVNDLNAHLAGLSGNVIPHGTMQVADAPNTVFRVLTASGELKTVSAEALTDMDGYPGELLAANQVMADLAERVQAQGTPYTSNRLRLVVAASEDTSSSPPRTWPASLPVPAGAGGPGMGRSFELSGTDAATVIRELADNYWQKSYPESLLHLPDGTPVVVRWRYLLPHE